MTKDKLGKYRFVYYSLRLSFWYSVIIWFLFATFDADSWKGINTFFTILWIISGFWTFVVSIIHLNTFKEKRFAVTALVISSLLLFLFFIGFMLGAVNYYG